MQGTLKTQKYENEKFDLKMGQRPEWTPQQRRYVNDKYAHEKMFKIIRH